jgi:hypothetical protein
VPGTTPVPDPSHAEISGRDLISYQNDRKGFTTVVGKAERR